MKTIGFFIAIFLLVSVTSCKSEKKGSDQEQEPTVTVVEETAPVEVDYKELSGYFLKNSYVPEAETNLIVVVDKDQLKTNFGVAKTMTNFVDTVDFSRNAVAAVALQPTNEKTEIKIDKIEKVGDELNIHIAILKGEKQSFTTSPVVLVSFRKDPTDKKIVLYVDSEKKVSKTL